MAWQCILIIQNRQTQCHAKQAVKLLELVENDVSYVVASSYLPDSAFTPVKGASNIGPRGLISHIRARIARSIKAKNVNCHTWYMVWTLSGAYEPPEGRRRSVQLTYIRVVTSKHKPCRSAIQKTSK